jgi:prepilin-type N-terminal cleavage/methylation domain-containing protein
MRNENGFTLIEAMISVALVSVAVFAGIGLTSHVIKSGSSMNQYATAVSIVDKFSEKALMLYHDNLYPGMSFQIYYDAQGVELPAYTLTTPNYVLKGNISTYASMTTLNEMTCNLEWNENGLDRKLAFRLIK